MRCGGLQLVNTDRLLIYTVRYITYIFTHFCYFKFLHLFVMYHIAHERFHKTLLLSTPYTSRRHNTLRLWNDRQRMRLDIEQNHGADTSFRNVMFALYERWVYLTSKWFPIDRHNLGIPPFAKALGNALAQQDPGFRREIT